MREVWGFLVVVVGVGGGEWDSISLAYAAKHPAAPSPPSHPPSRHLFSCFFFNAVAAAMQTNLVLSRRQQLHQPFLSNLIKFHRKGQRCHPHRQWHPLLAIYFESNHLSTRCSDADKYLYLYFISFFFSSL